jgi:hypothetical protein
MLRAASGKFAREERGSVMALTIVFALPLALFVFVTYNTGIALTTRMRAQNAADAAAYTGSLWRARMLNYFAYTRRQITADFATVALCTSLDSCLKMYDNIYDAQGLIAGGSGDEGLVTTLMEVPHAMLDAEQCFSDSESQNPVLILRKACDVLSGMLSESQEAVRLTMVAAMGGIMKKVVEDADRKAQADGSPGMEFDYTYTPTTALYLNREDMTKDQVEYYCDNFTMGNFLAAMALPGLGRAPVGGMTGGDVTYCGKSTPYIQVVTTCSSGVDIDSDGGKMKSEESAVFGYYVYVIVCVEGIPIPIGLPILANSTESEYSLKNPFNKAQVFQYNTSLPDSTMEMSTLATVEAKWDLHPFYMEDKGLGNMVSPKTLSPGKQIKAMSRAKTYFKGPYENLKNAEYDQPHLSYARFGAKLAPLEGFLLTQPQAFLRDAHY